jgi:hypothetical protein
MAAIYVKKEPVVDWIEDWMRPRVGLDVTKKRKKLFLKIILLSISNDISVTFCRLYPHKFWGQFCIYSERYGFNFSNKDLTNVVKFISVYPITSLGIGSS